MNGGSFVGFAGIQRMVGEEVKIGKTQNKKGVARPPLQDKSKTL